MQNSQKQTLIQILFVDLKNQPFKSLYHEVRKSGEKYALSAGNSDAQGLGVWIKQPAGTHLDIVVKHPITKKMIPVHQYIIVPDKKGKMRIQAPFYIEEKVKLQPREGEQGDYLRKTHTVKKGETLTSIAKHYGTDWQILFQLNRDKIENSDEIRVGQVIKVPPKNSAYRTGGISQSTKNQVTISNQYHANSSDNISSQSTHHPSSHTPNNGKSPSVLERANELVEEGIDLAKAGLNKLDKTTQPIRNDLTQALVQLPNSLNSLFDNTDGSASIIGSKTQNTSSTQSTSQQAPVQAKSAQIQNTQTSGQISTPRIDVTKQGNCSCGRDLTLGELNDIITKLRQSEGNKDTTLFNYKNCTLPQNERNSQTLLKYLNLVFNKYKINTCLRRIHFLSQIYLESASFTTTTEMKSGEQYNPGRHEKAIENGNTQMGDGPKYKGRGLMQLTWKNNYQLYQDYSNLNVVNNSELVASSMQNSMDSAGWFWYQGKIFSLKSYPNWKGPRDADKPKFLKGINWSYPSKKVTVKNKEHVTIDMNLIADSDKVDILSYLVNGGGNGLEARRKYVTELKKTFNYPTACKSIGLEKPQLASANVYREIAPWMQIALREAKQWKGVNEVSITDNYHSLIGYTGESLSATAWCASFVNYCLKDSGFSWAKNYSSQFPTMYPDKFVKIDKPIYGAIVVYLHTNKKYGTGHVAFIYGKLDNGDYAVLGGNQGNSITVNTHKHVYLDTLKCKLVGFFVPKEYQTMAKQLIATGKEFDGIYKLNELKNAIGDTTTATLRTQ